MTLGPLSEVRRRWAKEKREREIRAEADKRPPRVEVRHVPARPPIETPLPHMKPGETWKLVELNKRPEHRTIAVYLPLDYMHELREMGVPSVDVERFQAMEYRLDLRVPGGGTRVRWWGWQPVSEEHKRVVNRNLGRAAAMAVRVRELLSDPQLFFWDVNRNFAEMKDWATTALEDIEQAMGKP